MTSSSTVSFGPNSTLSMLQALTRSWQGKSQNQVDEDIALLKAKAPSLASGAIFIGQSAASKFRTTLIQTGLSKSDSSDDAINLSWSENAVANTQEQYTRQNSMTSKQIADALYSGYGLDDPSGHGNVSFSSIFRDMLSGSNPNTKLAKQISDAISSNSLTIEKASDVSGLNYQEVFTFAASGQGSSGGLDESWNTAATGDTSDENHNIIANTAPDGKHHLMINPTGMLGIYLSW